MPHINPFHTALKKSNTHHNRTTHISMSVVQTDCFCAAEFAHPHSKSSLTYRLRYCLWTVAFKMGVSVNSTVHGSELHGDPSSSSTVTLLGAAVLRMLAGTKSVT